MCTIPLSKIKPGTVGKLYPLGVFLVTAIIAYINPLHPKPIIIQVCCLFLHNNMY